MYSPGTTNPHNHTTTTWAQGLTRSLFALVWDASQLYKGCKHPRNPDFRWFGQSFNGMLVGLPVRKTIWVPPWQWSHARNDDVSIHGLPGRYTLHRVGSYVKANKRKVMSGYLSWHMLLCRDDAHTIGIRIVVGKVYNLCRV